ncbi:unnamed protein product [Cunninghamella echinulata]
MTEPVEQKMASLKVDDKKPAASKADKKAKKNKGNDSEYPLELAPAPEYIQHCINMFERLKAEYDESIKNKPRVPITITLPDGTVKEGTSWETSPMDIALGIAKSLAERTVIAKVNGEVWDLERPFEDSVQLELLILNILKVNVFSGILAPTF